MFERLNEVDWASMNHAYGSAADVPDLLRELVSDDPETRDQALYNAYGNIFHQGSRYEATAPTVPFLLEVLEQPDYPDKSELLFLLSHLVMGYGEGYLPFGFRAEIDGMRAELAELQARPQEERDADEKDSLGWGTDEDWLRWMVDITDEARKGVPRFVRLLSDDEPRVRIAAAVVLSWLPEDFEMFSPALWELVSNDPDDTVRANALIALAVACDGEGFDEYESEVTALLADGEPIVQFAAAVALGTRVEDPPDAVVQILLDAVARAGADDDEDADADEEDWFVAWFDGDYGSYASEVLAVVCADDPTRVVHAVIEALPGMQTVQAISAAGTILSLLFPEGFDGEASDLDDLQRRFLDTLAEHRNPWFMGDLAFANFGLMMGDFGLPSSMADLREFLG